eukprot:1160234-Pelagomonas_calceolata.AAC.2
MLDPSPLALEPSPESALTAAVSRSTCKCRCQKRAARKKRRGRLGRRTLQRTCCSACALDSIHSNFNQSLSPALILVDHVSTADQPGSQALGQPFVNFVTALHQCSLVR